MDLLEWIEIDIGVQGGNWDGTELYTDVFHVSQQQWCQCNSN